uniref:CCHC-type domain-containing protein n=1 Tax=Hordeum vulgare subsp. vulgare TaxID=112509 RepID=A0A8I6X8A5_HORVV
MEGSPWRVGKHAVLLKFFDADISPVDVVFDRLAIWARIIKLPTRLMRAARGLEIAKPIGNVIRVEADDLGRCWGPYMRIRVEVVVQKPLLRYVTVISSRLQSSAAYEVQYEHLPMYCFSCGLLGHSAKGCANPADRDENGDLPYSAKRLSVDMG